MSPCRTSTGVLCPVAPGLMSQRLGWLVGVFVGATLLICATQYQKMMGINVCINTMSQMLLA